MEKGHRLAGVPVMGRLSDWACAPRSAPTIEPDSLPESARPAVHRARQREGLGLALWVSGSGFAVHKLDAGHQIGVRLALVAARMNWEGKR